MIPRTKSPDTISYKITEKIYPLRRADNLDISKFYLTRYSSMYRNFVLWILASF